MMQSRLDLKSKFQLFLISISLVLPLQSYAQKTGYVLVPDTEGMENREKTMIANGDMKIVDGRYVLGEESLVFLGDLMRRGPYGKRYYRIADELGPQENANGAKVYRIIGNHDGNVLAFISMEIALRLSEETKGAVIPEFHDDLVRQSQTNTLYTRVAWIGDKYGLTDKLKNFWIEVAAEKSKIDPREFEKSNKIPFKLSEAAPILEKFVGQEQFASEFMEFCLKQGLEYLHKASIATVIELPNGKKFVLFHSGYFSQDNFGVNPDAAFNYYQRYSPKKNPGADANFDWMKLLVKDLNEFKDSELTKFEEIYAQLKAKAPTVQNLNQRLKLTRQLLSLKITGYVDAEYDEAAKKVEAKEANSWTYPNPEEQSAARNELPGIPDQEFIDELARLGYQGFGGGHDPVGSSPIALQAKSTENNATVWRLMTDSSFALDTAGNPVEGTDHTMIKLNGSVEVIGQNPDHTQSYLYALSDAEKTQMLDLIKDAANHPEEVVKATKNKLELYSRVGMNANGYLITGFPARINGATGKPEADLNKYFMRRQEGRNYQYVGEDPWAFAEKDEFGDLMMTVTYPAADFSKLNQATSIKKAELIEKKTGKPPQALDDVKKDLAGRMIIVSSGAARNSFNPVLDPKQGNADNVAKILAHWHQQIFNYPTSRKYAHITAGTTGVERRKTFIGARINEDRTDDGKPEIDFIQKGAGTLMLKGTEMDPNLTDFFLTGANSWIEYLPKLTEFLRTVDTPYPIVFEFVGGGGLIGPQIDYLRKMKAGGMNIKIVLFEGAHKQNGSSATDDYISKYLEDPASYPDLQVIRLADLKGDCSIIYGNPDYQTLLTPEP